MQIDISPLLELAVTAAAGLVATCVPVLTAWVGRRLQLQAGCVLLGEIEAAARTAGGLAYDMLVQQAAQPCQMDIKNAAVAAGVRHVVAAAPAALLRLRVAEPAVEAMVRGELGRLLAADPTIAAGPSAGAPGRAPATITAA